MPDVCVASKSWRSGAAWFIQMTVDAIAEAGASVAFVAPLAEPEAREPRHANVQRILLPREMVDGGARWSRALASIKRILLGLLWIVRLRASTRNYIFSIPEPLIFTLPLFAFLRLSGARVIFVVHDSQPHAWSLGVRFRGIERWAHRLSYRLASDIVCLTPAVGEALVREFGVDAGKVAVIPHGPFVLSGVGELPGNGKLLVFGSLRRNKSVLEVIEGVLLARRRDPGVSLILAGEPLRQEEGYWQQCLDAAASDPAAFDIREGFLSDADLPHVVAEADAFVLAYRDFNSQSGVGVLAAMAGRPIIGTRSGGLDELFARGMASEEVMAPVTPESVAEAILAYRARPIAEWRRDAAEAVDKVASGLSWKSIGEAYVRLLGRQA